MRPIGISDLPSALWTLVTDACAIVAIVALMGCTPTQTTLGAASLCSTAGDSLQVLAVARKLGKLSPAQVQTVYDAEVLINPTCTATTPPTDPVVAATNLALGLSSLAAVKTQVGGQ